MMFNISMAATAQCNQVIQRIGGLPITIKQAIGNDVMNRHNPLFVALLLLATYLTSVSIADQSGAPLMIPILASSAAINAASIHWIVATLFMDRQPIAHTSTRAEAAGALSSVLDFVYPNLFATLNAGKHDEIFRTATFRMRLTFAAFGGATLRAMRLMPPVKCSELLAALRTSAYLRSLYRFGTMRARLRTVDLLGMIGRCEDFPADGAGFHCILTHAASHDRCGQRGVSAASSGATLDHNSIVPQIGAVC